MSEFMTLGPGEDTARTDSLLEEIMPILLVDPSQQTFDNWYSIRSSWQARYGAVENIQLYANLAFEQFMEERNFAKAARIRLAHGKIHSLSARYAEAIDYMQEAVELATLAGDSVALGWALRGMVGPLSKSGQTEKAGERLNQSLLVAHRTNNRALEASTCIGKAVRLSRLARPEDRDSIRSFLNHSIEISREDKLVDIENLATSHLADIMIRDGEIEAATNLLMSALGNHDDWITVPRAKLLLATAKAFIVQDRPERAYDYLIKGCEISGKVELIDGMVECKLLTSKYYEKRGDPENALASYKEYYALDEKRALEETTIRVKQLENDTRLKDKKRQIKDMVDAENDRKAEAVRQQQNLLLLFGAIGALISGAFIIYRSRSRARLSDQHRIAAEAKLNVLQSQMNPHFIYNAMSGIQNYVLKSEKMAAYDHLGKFASMLRIITNSSDNIYIELEREIELLKTYLDLEKMRFRNSFDYTFDVAPNLLEENLNIPNMMIQPIVENAIIHGLSGINEGGMIEVAMQRADEDSLLCIVTDNGKGREAAAKIASKRGAIHLSVATGNGAQRIASLHELGYSSARVEIEDLKENGQACGTRVNIYLPFLKPTTTSP